MIYTKGIVPYFYKFFAEVILKKTIHRDQDSYFKYDTNIRKLITYPLLSYQNLSFISDIINEFRDDDRYDNVKKQVIFAVMARKKGYTGNLFELCIKLNMTDILKEW